ncbi:MAG: hypothetical protein NZ561_03610, partial [Phycisphaerae bacterium]|nr:hypothetical protein [Phycisphaerae bacterium]
AAYTNFHLLTTYTVRRPEAPPADAVFGPESELRMVDRGHAARSLLLQYALPAEVAQFDHPAVRNFTPLFRSVSDPRARPVIDWIDRSLKLNPPDPQVRRAFPTTDPETEPSTQPDGSG